jgi:glycosyltransferase involved in cell wall biosynthesis
MVIRGQATKTVTILQQGVPEYRERFWERFDSALAARGIELRVVAPELPPERFHRDSLSKIRCGHRVTVARLGKFYWLRGIRPHLRESDLVIMPQEAHFLSTYFVIYGPSFGVTTAFWGHGRNMQAPTPRRLVATMKSFLAKQVDWWFPYTSLSKEIVESYGFPADRITVVDNAIDTNSLRNRQASMSPQDLEAARIRLFQATNDRGKPKPTGIFCGRLIPIKWVSFLLESVKLIHEIVPEFQMVVVGDGPERHLVQQFCAEHDWCVATGAIHGLERVPTLSVGDVWLNPGMLGLAVLDAFALGIPVATTDNNLHSPEIAYLKDGVNGIITPPKPVAYAQAVTALLKHPDELQLMKESAAETGRTYTLERMIERFTSGILRCLKIESL